MHDLTLRAEAAAELRAGGSLREVSVLTGLSRSTLRGWLAQPEPTMRCSTTGQFGRNANMVLRAARMSALYNLGPYQRGQR